MEEKNMFKEIDKLSENLVLSERIKGLLVVLESNYLVKDKYDYSNLVEAYELCGIYPQIQILVETIFDLAIENEKKLNENIDNLMNKNRENKQELVEVCA